MLKFQIIFKIPHQIKVKINHSVILKKKDHFYQELVVIKQFYHKNPGLNIKKQKKIFFYSNKSKQKKILKIKI